MKMESRNKPRSDIPSWKIALFGGLAGEALWLASYPLDVVKSRMQTDRIGGNRAYKNMRDCFAKTYAKEGFVGFWGGLGPTLLRAMPVSAGTFFVYALSVLLHWFFMIGFGVSGANGGFTRVETVMRAIH